MRSTLIVAAAAVLGAFSGSASAQQLLPGERAVTVTEIPGVIAAGATWELIWADFNTADGIVGTPDGGILFAQEQTDSIRKLDVNNKEYVFVADAHGPGAVSMDSEGRVYAVQRTCTDPGRWHAASCPELTRVAMVAPEQKILANSFPDGKPLGRLNDLIADGKGGAYFTAAGLFYVNPHGVVSTIADKETHTNGLMLSRDGKILYVTDVTKIVAFDVLPDGSTRNRRDFADLQGDKGADGMTIDAQGRLYVTASQGVHVLAPDGKHLGLIPTPRQPITIAFSGPEKKTLYVGQMGAVGPDGKAWTTPQGTRNTAMTLYRIPMLAEGFKGRPK
ncbi:MAG TPA: SMP-30/gluconolactonase/LRE family protein [Steroidobacteraceae bacterium]|nr:SMP-30/gluconolactonase/LRE family protein [Steroidobacteraceae bacterium]